MFECSKKCVKNFFTTLQFKWLLSISLSENKFRLFRVIWQQNNSETKHLNRFSIAFMPALYSYVKNDQDDRRLTILGLSFHYTKNYNGKPK